MPAPQFETIEIAPRGRKSRFTDEFIAGAHDAMMEKAPQAIVIENSFDKSTKAQACLTAFKNAHKAKYPDTEIRGHVVKTDKTFTAAISLKPEAK